MTYKLPEPTYRRLSDLQSGVDDWYSASQMQAAYQAGRGSMREETVKDEPFAWVRDDGTMRNCMSNDEKNSWLNHHPRHVENYTIPVYERP